MIDKIVYTLFSWLDKFCNFLFDRFISDDPRNKKKKKK